MSTLETTVLIAEIILFAVLSVLGIYLIFALKGIVGSVKSIEQNVNELSSDIRHITGQVKKQAGTVDEIITSVKETTDSIIEFEKRAQEKIEGPVFESLNLISAIYTGVKTFLAHLTDSTNSKPHKKQIKSYSSLDDASEDF
ncbi:MAG: hypothetical protein ACRDFC_05975 [Ignavibacteria bacterium]